MNFTRTEFFNPFLVRLIEIKNNEIKPMQVHTKRHRLLHDRMKDLVFVKFNSRLKQKKDDMDKDPIEKRVHYVVLEDEDNKWITSIEPTKGDEEQEEETETSSQGVAAASQREIEERTKRVNWQKLGSKN